MNGKKSNGFAALILSVVVALAVVFGVKFAGGSSAVGEPSVTPGGQETAGKYAPGTYSATEKGFEGDVTVTITIGEGDVITDVVIEGASETPALGGAAMEQMQAEILESQAVPADVVSGASFTSNAVIKAAQSCLDAAASADGGAAGAGGAYKAGTYTHTEKGYMGDVTVTIVVGDDGSITEVTIEGASETPALGGVAMEQMQAEILEKQAAPVDVVSGASFTSNAVIAAAQACLADAAN